MISRGDSDDDIVDVTGLTMEQISQLRTCN